MRRLAIVFMVLVSVHTIERAASSGKFATWRSIRQAPRRINNALASLGEWKKFLVGKLRLAASTLGARLPGEVN
jgi:hypothetical protein